MLIVKTFVFWLSTSRSPSMTKFERISKHLPGYRQSNWLPGDSVLYMYVCDFQRLFKKRIVTQYSVWLCI